MAYVPDNLVLLSSPIGGASPRLFGYNNSTPDGLSTLNGAGYWSDGIAKGLRAGDLIDVVQTGTVKYIRLQVASVSTSAGTATTAAPTAIT
ncbi:hypothetical protein GOZ96_04740 [Agrobacterium vitis]|uniref:Uncharacterized protein n=1 Tax=Agrobacterium vitis TaxID=373 RepID=A0A7J4X4G2_AGRVI|nr:hypothetical protein [Agrobacterium vitis]KAA3527051.1 hypothetical protein DXT89_14040 [Agrobacterium vitis]MUZ95896.1 hypothetical protein [Agrobacterium vitis]